MTKERLKELIKQGATIYDKSGYSINLSEKDSFMENILEFYYTIEDNRLLRMQKQPHIALNQWWIKELFETKEQAEWALKTTAEHTERFEPPMWEEIKRFYGFSFYGNVIDELYHREEYRFFVDKLAAITVFDISKKQPFRDVYSACSTKENYEKACEIVRDLFKGEK